MERTWPAVSQYLESPGLGGAWPAGQALHFVKAELAAPAKYSLPMKAKREKLRMGAKGKSYESGDMEKRRRGVGGDTRNELNMEEYIV